MKSGLPPFLFLIVTLATILPGEPVDTNFSPAQAAWREDFLNDEILKNILKNELLAENDVDTGNSSTWNYAIRFKEVTNLSDERLHSSLTDIYHEAVMQINASPSKDVQTLMEAKQQARTAIFWFGLFSDSATKTLLLDLASDTSQESGLRIIAIASYLRAADAQETSDALVRFLAGECSGIDKLSIYSHAQEVYDKATRGDVAKQRAIIAALIVAAANERGKIGFVEVDRILAMRSAAYRHSRERLALLEHHSQAPPTRNLYTDADLERALAEVRRQRSFTSVNTNVALLKAHNFENEPAADELELWGGEIVVPDEAELLAPRGVRPAEPAKPWAKLARWLPVVLSLALLVVGGGWGLRRLMRRA